MHPFRLHTRIDRWKREYTVLNNPPGIPPYNGNFVWGETRPSGTDNEHPELALIHFEIDDEANQVTSQEIWRVVLSGLVQKNDGQKVVWPSFDATSGRLFVRVRSSNGDFPSNVIQEIDPEDGSYIGSPLEFSGGGLNGAFTDYLEISTGGTMYVPTVDGDYVQTYDLGFNPIRKYGPANNSSTARFAVSENRDIALIQNPTDARVKIFSSDGSLLQTITASELGETQVAGARMSNTHIIVECVNNLYCIDRSDYSVLWTLPSDDFDTTMFGLDGSLYIERREASDVYLRKTNLADGTEIWETHALTETGGLSPNITYIMQIAADIVACWHGVAGTATFFKTGGTKLSGNIGIGRGNVGLHPFNNDRIQNYDL